MRQNVKTLERSRGFNIIEISIALTIIAFMIGAITVGQGLIEAGQLRAVTVEVRKYQTAIEQFQDKYYQLPGDLVDAANYFSCGSCNGDGDEAIEWPTEGPDAWYHLQAAGMIESYGFTAASGDNTGAEIGVNVPDSDFEGGGYYLDNGGTFEPFGGSGADITLIGNYLHFGTDSSTSTAPLNAAVLTPKQASQIDAKIDDGLPSGAAGGVVKGKVIGTGGADGADCATTDYVEYNTTLDEPACMLHIRLTTETSLI